MRRLAILAGGLLLLLYCAPSAPPDPPLDRPPPLEGRAPAPHPFDAGPTYRSAIAVTLSTDGCTAYVVSQTSDSVFVVDLLARRAFNPEATI